MLSLTQQEQIRSLNIEQLESLGKSLLDFTEISDLDGWLLAHL
ncbi:MAG: DUF4351 domain-containing protein [Aphanizomenon gracile PMC649.10]|nr:DUF4351 domain-containing protein [Dolichospermum sp. LEGE 00240]MDM3843616.1 DUF4351 domain-containing protein [Aphanizomenon gracile PMC638.10]MDM3851208.1 DUF4351 domain-containing protein [Aphanizomenon gracile PMC627.10]MDM3854968.1 DUF4351 domain-containing protein [Aphanizomenon gracile PMC649.10]MDM3861877.1 DUF4351 domain-containing protein [Aphanizomenon gracile PMC644.10]